MMRVKARLGFAQRSRVRSSGAGADPPRKYLAVVGVRSIAVRMLFNLQQAHERRGDHARALVACDRLVDLSRINDASDEDARRHFVGVSVRAMRRVLVEHARALDLHAVLVPRDERVLARAPQQVGRAFRRSDPCSTGKPPRRWRRST